MFRVRLTKPQRALVDLDDDQWRLQLGLTLDGEDIIGGEDAMRLLAGAFEDRADPEAGFELSGRDRATARRAAKIIRGSINPGTVP